MASIPDQTEVRTRGGKTTVTLRSAGTTTLKRLAVLLDELNSNHAIVGDLHKAVGACIDSTCRLHSLISGGESSEPSTAEQASPQSIEESHAGSQPQTPPRQPAKA